MHRKIGCAGTFVILSPFYCHHVYFQSREDHEHGTEKKQSIICCYHKENSYSNRDIQHHLYLALSKTMRLTLRAPFTLVMSKGLCHMQAQDAELTTNQYNSSIQMGFIIFSLKYLSLHKINKWSRFNRYFKTCFG